MSGGRPAGAEGHSAFIPWKISNPEGKPLWRSMDEKGLVAGILVLLCCFCQWMEYCCFELTFASLGNAAVEVELCIRKLSRGTPFLLEDYFFAFIICAASCSQSVHMVWFVINPQRPSLSLWEAAAGDGHTRSPISVLYVSTILITLRL